MKKASKLSNVRRRRKMKKKINTKELPPLINRNDFVTFPEALDLVGRYGYPSRWPRGWTHISDNELIEYALDSLIGLLQKGIVRSFVQWSKNLNNSTLVAIKHDSFIEVDPSQWITWSLLSYNTGIITALIQYSELMTGNILEYCWYSLPVRVSKADIDNYASPYLDAIRREGQHDGLVNTRIAELGASLLIHDGNLTTDSLRKYLMDRGDLKKVQAGYEFKGHFITKRQFTRIVYQVNNKHRKK